MEFQVRDFTDSDRALAAQWVSLLPTHLFKYRTLTGEGKDRLAGLVRDSTLYFPTFAELNDPFDSNFSYDFSAPVEVREGHWRHALPPDLPDREAAVRAAVEFALDEEKANASVRELLSKFGVYCLTAKPDNILIWSYYADGHSGVCLRFRMEDLFVSYCRDGGLLVPVEYLATYPTVPYFGSGVITLVHGGIGTKATAWEHEVEWRIVHPKISGALPCRRPALDGIILGCRISIEDERFVRELAVSFGIPVLKASKMEREYGIQIEGHC